MSSLIKAFTRTPPTGESNILPALYIPTEQVASCHFFSNFILIPQQGGTKGFMAYLQPLMRSEGQNSHLQHAFKACSLAHLGNRVRSNGGDILDRALSEYTKALAATHTALASPESCRTDASLAAVLLLGLYEVSSQSCFPFFPLPSPARRGRGQIDRDGPTEERSKKEKKRR